MKFKMETSFGKRHGWELQRLTIQRRVFWRLTVKTWCRPASAEEIALWKLLQADTAKLPLGAKRAIALALECAIRVLEGGEPIQHPAARARTACKLRKAQAALRREKVIW